MTTNYPYVSLHYFSKNFTPQELAVQEEQLKIPTKWRFQNETEFIFILSGKGTIKVNGLEIPLSKNQLLQLLPYHVFQISPKDNEELHIIRFYFSLGLSLLTATNEANYLQAMKGLEHDFPLYQLTERKSQHLILLSEDLKEEAALGHSTENLNISLVSYLMYLCQSQKQLHYSYPFDDLGTHALHYLQFHHQDPINSQHVAQALRTSTTEVETALKNLTGFSFSHLLNQVRIRNATALMTFPELKIADIGKICGFDSLSYFYKEFQKIHQTTPENYRQQLKAKKQLVPYDDAWDVIYFMMNHCHEKLTLTFLSQQLHLETSKIHQLLKEKFQMTFKQLLNQFRCQFAHTLLLATSLSIEEVQEKVGYQDENTFTRNYKNFYHQTPFQTKKTARTI